MPLLYGKGTKAIQRLHEEILGMSTDMSIFLWQGSASDAFGMLALRPSCFAGIPDSVRTTIRSHTELFSMARG